MTVVFIPLNEAHIAYADKVAWWRHDNCNRNNRRPANGAPIGAAGLENDILGTRTELAKKLYLNPVKWHAYKEYGIKDSPDLEDWIDVKGIRYERHSLIVPKDAEDDWAYPLVCAESHPVYQLMGWLYGWEAKQPQFLKAGQPGREKSYFIKPSDKSVQWRSPESLYEEVRRRQGLLVDKSKLNPTMA